MIARRRMLGWFAGAGATALVAGCGAAAPRAGMTAGGRRCVAGSAETSGPFPADGTNKTRGSTGNVLTASGIERRDIRSSFIGSATAVPGVPVTLTITLTDVNASCAALSGHAVYIWHCDRSGQYSLYDVPTESWLRGMQVSDSGGTVTFTTIFPGCYPGRYPHLHFEVFTSRAAATSGRAARLTSQLAMPGPQCDQVYANATGYSASAADFAHMGLTSDYVFGDNSAAQIAAQTLTMTGDATSGYAATVTVGIAV